MFFQRFYSSSKNWLSRQAKDPYCKAAKANQYRARSAYKLIQINDKYKLIRPAYVVIDCGAAPGGWSQVAAEKVQSEEGLVIGVDLLPIDPIPNVHLIQGNFLQKSTQRKIYETMNNKKANLINGIV
ncbi:hypothetical protein G6F56_013537 [Rhizopus delemar]|nr:hypothetical protein G6F56_013537 [Rhizopus delemar]